MQKKKKAAGGAIWRGLKRPDAGEKNIGKVVLCAVFAQARARGWGISAERGGLSARGVQAKPHSFALKE